MHEGPKAQSKVMPTDNHYAKKSSCSLLHQLADHYRCPRRCQMAPASYLSTEPGLSVAMPAFSAVSRARDQGSPWQGYASCNSRALSCYLSDQGQGLSVAMSAGLSSKLTTWLALRGNVSWSLHAASLARGLDCPWLG